MAECDLCGLPTPDPPVGADDVDGRFCCRGCLEVGRRLDAPAADVTVSAAREAVAGAATEAGDDGEATTAYLAVSGMHCATCEAFLEGRARDRDGVLDAGASYASGLIRVVYDPDRIDEATLADHLDVAGYTARPVGAGTPEGPREETGRLLVGGFFGMMVMAWYVLFLYPVYLGLPAAAQLLDLSGTAGTYLLWNVWVMTTVVLGYTGAPRLRGALVSLRAGVPNMDLLVALAAVAAYAYSTLALLAGRTELYFDVVVAIVVVVALGKHYESRVTRRAAGHLADVAAARVETARRRTPAGTSTVPVDDLSAGDELVVRAGERVPVDGTVVEGTAALDESLLTGAATPRSVGVDDEVPGGATVADGALVVVAAGAESTIDRLVAHLWAVQTGRGGAQRLADRLAAVFVPTAIILAVAAAAWRLLAGGAPRPALLAGLAVLVVSCPCALGLATPLAVSRAVGVGLERGVVVTDASVFDRGASVELVVLDKTGTLTTGEMAVRAVVGEDAVLERAAAVEQFAGHPIAEAVVEAAADGGWSPAGVDAVDFERHAGRGVSGTVDGDRVVVGSRALLVETGHAIPDRLERRAETAREQGAVPAFVGWAGAARGVIVAGDRPRDGWEAAVAALAAGRRVVVLTGDEGPTDWLTAHPDVSEVFAGVPPEAKAAVVERLREQGPVAMVGDGTNDASALAAADVGIAIERGAALASDAADVVITTGALSTVPSVLDLTAATRRRIRENLAWAFAYNAVAIPAALLGLLTPLLAAAAMAASSLLVVGNSARGYLADGAAVADEPGSDRREVAEATPGD